MSSDQHNARRPLLSKPGTWLAFLVLVLSVAEAWAWYMPNTWIRRDGRFYVNVNDTLVRDLGLDQQRFAPSWYEGKLGWNRNLDEGWSNVALGRNGEHWPKHPILLPLLSAPLYFAFGPVGTLAFNLLVYGLTAWAGWIFLLALGRFRPRRDEPDPGRPWAADQVQAWSIGLALVLFLLGTTVRLHVYDYLLDPLLLCLFLLGLACLVTGRGVWAGILGLTCVFLRPTCVVLLPSAFLLIAERRDWRTLRRALVGGGLAVVGWGALNWFMFGRPWWTGYHRTLVVLGGIPQPASHLDSFPLPFWDGLWNNIDGPIGLLTNLGPLVLALPGLALAFWRRPFYAAAAVLGLSGSLLIYASYRFADARFHFVAAALLLPALASTLRLANDLLRRLGRRWRHLDVGPTAILAGLSAAVALVPVLDRLAPDSPLNNAWLWLDLPSAWLLFFAAVLVAARFAPVAWAAVAVAGLSMLPPIRETLLGNHQLLAASALAMLSLHLALAGWLSTAVGCGLLAAGLADGPWLVALAPFLLLRPFRLRAALRPAAVLLVGLGLGALWMIFGAQRSFASGGGSAADLLASLENPGAARTLVPLGVLAGLSLVLITFRRWRWSLAWALCLASVFLPGVAGARAQQRWPLFFFFLIGLVLPVLAGQVQAGSRWLARRMTLAARLSAVGALVALLLVVGAGRRISENAAPFRIGSERSLFDARVFLDQIPCDFLGWTHMAWECSHHDNTIFSGMVGLGLPQGLSVSGQSQEMLLIPSGRWGRRARTVVWTGLAGGRRLTLRYAVPDGLRGGARVLVRSGELDLDRFDVPLSTAGRILERRVDTAALSRPLDLSIEVQTLVRGKQAHVAFSGGWDQP